MKIGELFVELGAKGGEQLDKSLKTTKSSMGEVYSSSLALKAAILGIAYGMQQMMSQSSGVGAELTNFNALTGISVQNLQRWQYAARQVNVSNEEVAGSFKSVQSSISNMLLGKGPIQGYDLVAQKVGLDEKRLRDTEYVMGKLQEFAKKVPADVGNQMLKSFGLGDGMISAMRRNAFRPEVMKRAPVYSQGETQQLDRVNAAWSNLGNKVQMAFGRFTTKHGMQLVSDLSKITDQVVKLADSFVKLSEKIKLFEGIGKVFQGWGMLFESLSGMVDEVGNKKGSVGSNLKNFGKNSIEGFMMATKGALLTAQDALETAQNSGVTQSGKSITNNTTVNQNLNFRHDGKDAVKTGNSVNKAARDAIRTSQSQKQVN